MGISVITVLAGVGGIIGFAHLAGVETLKEVDCVVRGGGPEGFFYSECKERDTEQATPGAITGLVISAYGTFVAGAWAVFELLHSCCCCSRASAPDDEPTNSDHSGESSDIEDGSTGEVSTTQGTTTMSCESGTNSVRRRRLQARLLRST